MDTRQPGTVTCYVSDQQNAIDEFAYLNVKVTRVGCRKANATESENA